MLSEDSDIANVAPERQDPEEVLFQLGGTNSPRFTGYASTVVTYVSIVKVTFIVNRHMPTTAQYYQLSVY